jgi:hypothetical protein
MEEWLARGGLGRSEPPPGAYIEDASPLVALKTAEYMAWLGHAR